MAARKKSKKPHHPKHPKHTKHVKHPKHTKHATHSGAHRKHAHAASEHPVIYHVPGTPGEHHGGHHSAAHGAHHSAPHHPHTPATEWDRLWHAYIEANRSGSLMDQIRAGRALLRFDKTHGTPALPHLIAKLREAHELLVKHGEAFEEAKKLDRELKAAERLAKRHAERTRQVHGILEKSSAPPRGLQHSRRGHHSAGKSAHRSMLALPRLR